VVNLLRATRQPRPAARYDDFHVFGGNQYWNNVLTTWEPEREGIGSDFVTLVNGAYKGNAIVAACELTRMALVSEARPQWRNRDRMNLYGNPTSACSSGPGPAARSASWRRGWCSTPTWRVPRSSPAAPSGLTG
jgi:hypothetical protein